MRTKPLTAGKVRGLQQIADAYGIFAMGAMDHRGSMQRMINKAAPEPVTYDLLVEYKRDLTELLAPASTAVLLDPIYGAAQVITSGAVYLGVLSLLALRPSALLGYGYLVLYNLVFVLPLVVLLIAASARPTLRHLAHWNLHHKEWVRLTLGSAVAVMGLLLLVTV